VTQVCNNIPRLQDTIRVILKKHKKPIHGGDLITKVHRVAGYLGFSPEDIKREIVGLLLEDPHILLTYK
jgi:hypothetical protein